MRFHYVLLRRESPSAALSRQGDPGSRKAIEMPLRALDTAHARRALSGPRKYQAVNRRETRLCYCILPAGVAFISDREVFSCTSTSRGASVMYVLT